MATILCIADAPGPAEFLAPVLPLLADDTNVSVITVGTAMNVLKSFSPMECNDETLVEKLFGEIKPDVLVSAISSLTHGPYVNNALVKLAHAKNIPVVSLQDYWGNHRWPHNKEIIPYLAAVCVPDEFAASLWREDNFKGKIFVTGNPAFDRFAKMDVAQERERLRIRLKLTQEDHLILFAGQGTPKHIEADKKTFAYIMEAIRELSATMPVKLIARYHPRAVEIGYYEDYAHGIEIIDTTPLHAEFSDTILPVADVIVSMFSTNLIHACYVRIPGVSVLLPEWGMATFQSIGLDDFPPNQMGATVGVYGNDPAELGDMLKKIFSDESFRSLMREAQEKNFPLNGDAAERAAAVVHRFLG